MKKTYAIGDIHGMLSMLTRVMDQIAADPADEKRIVFLGDYIDRGRESKGVLDLLMNLQATRKYKDTTFESVVCLRGNHEQMMIDAVDFYSLRLWLLNGGNATLDSFNDKLGQEYIDWAKTLPTIHEDAQRIYVHAGLHPNDMDNEKVHMWIRRGFVDVDHDFGKLVVHGHTAEQREDGTFTEKPWFGRYRIGLDTGSCFGGELTCAVFDDENPRHLYFLTAK
jgi:serine/threonine protein phosphatase 1